MKKFMIVFLVRNLKASPGSSLKRFFRTANYDNYDWALSGLIFHSRARSRDRANLKDKVLVPR